MMKTKENLLIILYNFTETGTCTGQSKESELDPLNNAGKLTDMIH